tara:strand:- start:729 stop:1250 length:522 start_codon:yes stop_codon:yes gene_type:complete
MQIKVNPGSMITTAIGLYLLILLIALVFWPENWVDPSSVEIIIFSLGVLVGGLLVQLLYTAGLYEKQDEVDDFLSVSGFEIDQKKSELKSHINHVKDREEFLLKALDKLISKSSDEAEESEVVEEQEEAEELKEEDDEMDFEIMSVTQLKELLKQKGLPISGKKTDLIARLRE